MICLERAVRQNGSAKNAGSKLWETYTQRGKEGAGSRKRLCAKPSRSDPGYGDPEQSGQLCDVAESRS